jgi:hypothetical protein
LEAVDGRTFGIRVSGTPVIAETIAAEALEWMAGSEFLVDAEPLFNGINEALRLNLELGNTILKVNGLLNKHRSRAAREETIGHDHSAAVLAEATRILERYHRWVAGFDQLPRVLPEVFESLDVTARPHLANFASLLENETSRLKRVSGL